MNNKMAAQQFSQQSFDYQRIEQALQFLESNFTSQPGLGEIAQHAHVSKYHFQRLFKRWVGISPTQFLQFLTLEYTKQKLAEGRSILETSYEAGLSGPGRLHDLFVTFEAMTPGEYKNWGADLHIEYGFHPTPFGECLLAITSRGICHLSFIQKDGYADALSTLQRNWAYAAFTENAQKTQDIIARLFATHRVKNHRPFHLLVKGTNFQVNVWQALLTLPKGSMVCYQDIAVYLGIPTSIRAVANAMAKNPIAYLIPCHRVITKTGKIDRYRWGTARKKAILGWEAASLTSHAIEA